MNDYTEVETCVEVSIVQRFASGIAPPNVYVKLVCSVYMHMEKKPKANGLVQTLHTVIVVLIKFWIKIIWAST